VTVEDWKQAVEHAQCMVKSEERKASAQRAHYKRRLASIEIESSERLRVSVKEAEAQVNAMERLNKKVRVRVRVRVRVGVRAKPNSNRALTLSQPEKGEAPSIRGAGGLPIYGAKCAVACRHT
jgi:hypothetical protein